MFGLIISLIYKNNILEKTFALNNLDDIKIELINYLATEFNKLSIDFPLQLIQFENIWCDINSMEQIDNIFYYNIFDSNNSKCIIPWD